MTGRVSNLVPGDPGHCWAVDDIIHGLGDRLQQVDVKSTAVIGCSLIPFRIVFNTDFMDAFIIPRALARVL